MHNFQLQTTIDQLYKESEKDHLFIPVGILNNVFRTIQPLDFKDAFLSIRKEQGDDLVRLIRKHNIKNIVEFGTSFGISTLFLAKGVKENKGRIITTELIESKAKKARENFAKARVSELIDLRIGDAQETLKGHRKQIDLLLLDGWKNLYLAIFNLLEPNFHQGTIVYVDNADMTDCQSFLKTVSQNPKYQFEFKEQGTVALITINN